MRGAAEEEVEDLIKTTACLAADADCVHAFRRAAFHVPVLNGRFKRKIINHYWNFFLNVIAAITHKNPWRCGGYRSFRLSTASPVLFFFLDAVGRGALQQQQQQRAAADEKKQTRSPRDQMQQPPHIHVSKRPGRQASGALVAPTTSGEQEANR